MPGEERLDRAADGLGARDLLALAQLGERLELVGDLWDADLRLAAFASHERGVRGGKNDLDIMA